MSVSLFVCLPLSLHPPLTPAGLFTPDHVPRVAALRAALLLVKDRLLDLLEGLRERWAAMDAQLHALCVPTLGDRLMDEKLRFFAAHKVALSAVFDAHGADAPPLPLSVPHVSALQGTTLLRDTAQYTEQRALWMELKAAVGRYYAAADGAWPRSMPNVSTHNCRPPLPVAGFEDLVALSRVCCEYMDGMQRVLSWWTVVLRSLFDSIDVCDTFAAHPVPVWT
jgi:hypothetical protein